MNAWRGEVLKQERLKEKAKPILVKKYDTDVVKLNIET